VEKFPLFKIQGEYSFSRKRSKLVLAVLGRIHFSVLWKSAQQSKRTDVMGLHLRQKVVPVAFCHYGNWITAQDWVSACSAQRRDSTSLHCFLKYLLCSAGGCTRTSGVAGV